MFGLLQEENKLERVFYEKPPSIPGIGLIFYTYQDIPIKVRTSRAEFDLPKGYILPPFKNGYECWQQGQFGMFCVLFKPGRFTQFFNVSATELTDQIVDISDFDKSLVDLHDSILHATNTAQIIQLANNYFLHKLKRINEPNQETQQTLLFLNNKPTLKVYEIIQNLNFTERHSRRLFKEHIGLSIKQYQRVLKLTNASLILRNNPGIRISDLAYRLNYSDPSHFIADFRSFTGYTPKKFISIHTPVSDLTLWNEEIIDGKSIKRDI